MAAHLWNDTFPFSIALEAVLFPGAWSLYVLQGLETLSGLLAGFLLTLWSVWGKPRCDSAHLSRLCHLA